MTEQVQKYYVSLVLMIKDEGCYLAEWLNYHSWIGVDHFYICDDGSIPPITTKHPKAQVMRTDLRQMQLYSDMLNKYGHTSKWMGFIDTDEFIVSINGEKLPDILKDYENEDALGLNWATFGSSGFVDKQKQMIPNFVMRTPDSLKINRHIKSIVQPHLISLGVSSSPHYFKCRTVNEKHQLIQGPFSPYSGERIRINHYYTRSKADFVDKINRGRSIGPGEKQWKMFSDVDDESVIIDTLLKDQVASAADLSLIPRIMLI